MKGILLTLTLLISGCGLGQSDIDFAENVCKSHGSTTLISYDNLSFTTTIRCSDGLVIVGVR